METKQTWRDKFEKLFKEGYFDGQYQSNQQHNRLMVILEGVEIETEQRVVTEILQIGGRDILENAKDKIKSRYKLSNPIPECSDEILENKTN